MAERSERAGPLGPLFPEAHEEVAEVRAKVGGSRKWVVGSPSVRLRWLDFIWRVMGAAGRDVISLSSRFPLGSLEAAEEAVGPHKARGSAS